jgi:hypothetical protein
MTRSALTSHRPGSLLTGCLVVIVVILLALIAGGIYVALHWKGWTADLTLTAATAIVQESGLPQDQRDQILAEVRKLGNDFKDGKITTDQLAGVGEAILHSPLIHLAAVQAARTKYIDTSDMTPEEKAAAVRSLQRFARGIYEKSIVPAEEQVTDAIKPIVRLKPGNKWEFKEHPTRQEIDQFVANCKARADEAKVPDEPFDLKIADELKKAIDQALGRNAEPTPAAPPPATPKPGGG